MKDTVIENVKCLMNEKGLNETSFSMLIGVKQRTFNQQLKIGLSPDTIYKILDTFDNLSADWLLRRIGSMYRNKADINQTASHGGIIGSNITINKINEQSSINERIQTIINDFFDSNVSQFEKQCGLKPATVKHVIGGRLSKPSYEVIEHICRTVVHIDANWLITGEGKMEKENYTNSNNSTLIEELKEELYMIKGENRLLREQLGLGERKDEDARTT